MIGQVAFISGGWLPQKVRGTTIHGVMHICDWYASFAAFAGVNAQDERAAALGLPPIDSLDMSAMLLGLINSRVDDPNLRSVLVLGQRGLGLGKIRYGEMRCMEPAFPLAVFV